MTTVLPHLPESYAWRLDTHLTTEELNRDEIRVSIYKATRTRILHRTHYVLVSSKQKRLHEGLQREKITSKMAKKLYKKFQQAAYEEAVIDHAAFLAQENVKLARLQRYTIS